MAESEREQEAAADFARVPDWFGRFSDSPCGAKQNQKSPVKVRSSVRYRRSENSSPSCQVVPETFHCYSEDMKGVWLEGALGEQRLPAHSLEAGDSSFGRSFGRTLKRILIVRLFEIKNEFIFESN